MIQSLPSTPYVADILRQPDAARDALAVYDRLDLRSFAPFAAGLSSGSLERVVLTGMGSSYHAFHPLFLTLTERGIPAQMIETSELIHHAPRLISPRTLIVAASQSGRSAEILQLVGRTGKSVPLIGVTNDPGSPLANGSQATLLLHAGDEASVSCKTYVNTLLALALVGDLLSGQAVEHTLSALRELPEALADYLAQWEAHVESGLQEMQGVQTLILAGRGASLAAAGTGGLIIKEAAHFPAEGMSSAAFRHGPMELVSPQVFVAVFAGASATRALNADLAADVQKAGGRSALVSAGEAGGLFCLPPVPAVCLPMLEILPAQMLSLVLALQRGRIPGQFERATKVTLTE